MWIPWIPRHFKELSMKYRVILIDLDDTLLDFDKAEELSLRSVLEMRKLPLKEGMVERYKKINKFCWTGLEQGIYDKNTCINLRFQLFCREYGLDVDPAEMNRDFLDGLITHSSLLDGAEEILETIKHREVVLLTNGVKRVQLTKIKNADLGKYVKHIVISDDVGYAKPDPRIFEHAHRLVGDYAKADMVMIGDSASSDIAGGLHYGIDTIWYNPRGLKSQNKPTHEVKTLSEILKLI